jgi:hypothetical protein
MRPISCIFSGLLLLAAASAAYSQSLADLAKKEKERRQAVKTATKVITNDQAAKYHQPPISIVGSTSTTGSDQAGTEKTAGGGEAGAAAAKDKDKELVEEPVDFQGRPESFWRQTFTDARQKVQDLENEGNVLTLKYTDLQNRFYREDNGFKQQEIQREMQKTIYEQDMNKENLTKAKASLADLENEARKSGALPGWIRESKKRP